MDKHTNPFLILRRFGELTRAEAARQSHMTEAGIRTNEQEERQLNQIQYLIALKTMSGLTWTKVGAILEEWAKKKR